MDMSMSMATTTSMDMSATATAAASPTTTTSMDMGTGDCTISMLWNWNTVGSCFLSESWYIRSNADFGGTVVGIFSLCMLIELMRRIGREYDRRLTVQSTTLLENNADKQCVNSPASARSRVSWPQQVIRGLIYGSQFTSAFLVMLLGMYFNGFVLLAIFLGQTLGYIVFGRDTAAVAPDSTREVGGICC